MILEALPSSLITTCKGSPFEDEPQIKQLGKGKSSSYCSIIVPVNTAFFYVLHFYSSFSEASYRMLGHKDGIHIIICAQRIEINQKDSSFQLY